MRMCEACACTVCRVVTTGQRRVRISSSTNSPWTPPKMPNSCCSSTAVYDCVHTCQRVQQSKMRASQDIGLTCELMTAAASV